jgi:TonB family protein
MRTCVAFCLLLAAAFAIHAAEPSPVVQSPPSLLKVIHYSAPVYPAEALKQHLGGLVIVAFMIDVNGIVHEPHVVKATAPGVFDAAALEAVKSWVYEPKLVNGKPVEARVQAIIRFDNGPVIAASFATSSSAPLHVTVAAHTAVDFDTFVDHLKDQLADHP